MPTITIPQINERLRSLLEDKLVVIFDFIFYLAEREMSNILSGSASKCAQCMYASEQALAKDWNLPEEDEAWKNL